MQEAHGRIKVVDFWRQAFLLKLVLRCHHIHWFPLVVQFLHRLENDAVLLFVEISLFRDFHSRYDGFMSHQHRADD